MAPLPLRLVIVERARLPAFRTLPPLHFRVVQIQRNFTLLQTRLHPLHEPRPLDPKNLCVELSILHGLLSCHAGPLVPLPTH